MNIEIGNLNQNTKMETTIYLLRYCQRCFIKLTSPLYSVLWVQLYDSLYVVDGSILNCVISIDFVCTPISGFFKIIFMINS